MSDKTLKNLALGMIETRGLVGAIEAVDAACKAAQVELVGSEKIRNGCINFKFVGEVAAIRSAMEAGAAAAQKVGNLVGIHIIPNPSAELDSYIYDRGLIREQKSKKEEILDEDESLTEEEQITIDYSVLNEDESVLSQKLEKMTVHELRRMARGIEGLSIAGREISKANKEKLIFEILDNRRKK